MTKRLTLILTTATIIILACLTPTTTPTHVSPAQPGATQDNLAVRPAQAGVLPAARGQEANTPTATSDPTRCARVTADSLHVRFRPDYNAPVEGWFTQDEPLKALDDSGDWWKVNGQGIDFQGRHTRLTGYVNAEYLTETKCKP
jgi:hypothetical protein